MTDESAAAVSTIAAARARATSALRRPHNWVQLAKFCTVGAIGYALNLLRFFIVSLLALGANELLLTGFIAAGLGKVVAQAIAVVLVTPINFVGNKLWSFRRR
jgi:putative flippase GtrA